MPTYEYACTECGHQLEAVQKFTDDPLTECPVCGGKLRKVFSSVGIVFKGSGFYRTDSRQAAAVGATSSDSGSTSATDSGASSTTSETSSSKPDAASSDSSKPAATPAAKTAAPAGPAGSEPKSSKPKPGGSKPAADS